MGIQSTENNLKIHQVFIAIFLIIGLTLIIHIPSINYYFLQDDWFVLNWVRSNNLPSFFEFRTDIIYWRPLSMPIFFWIGKTLFGLNPFGFHLISFLLHFFNILLLSTISLLIFKNIKAALLSGLLFATASFHFMTLSWLSLTWNLIGLLFFQLAVIVYLLYRIKKSYYKYFGIFTFFLLSLISNEFAITFPFLIIAVELMLFTSSKRKYLNIAPVIVPIILVIITYIISRIILFPIPSEGEYELTLNIAVLKNMFWYILWFFNVPEELKYQIILTNFKVTENFLNAARNYMPIILFTVVTNIILVFYFSIKCLNKITTKPYIASGAFFIIGLLPILFLNQHSFPYYLTFASILLFILLGLIISIYLKINKSTKSAVLVLIFIATWLIASYTTVSLARKIHWVTAEQILSKEQAIYVKEKYPNEPKDSTIVINQSSKQIIQSLMDQNAFQVIYNNDEVKTIYK